MIAQHRADLSHDLSGGEVPLHTQKGRETEPAIHGTAYLAGDADRCPTPIPQARIGFVTGVTAVAGFPAISLRHPDRLDRLPIGTSNEVTDCAVDRAEFAGDLGRSDRQPTAA